jgi:hypothetical protein
MTGLLDTNVALYLLGGRMAAPLPAGSYGISVISEMELLSWPSLTRQEEKTVYDFLGQLHRSAREPCNFEEKNTSNCLTLSSAPRRWNLMWHSGRMILLWRKLD